MRFLKLAIVLYGCSFLAGCADIPAPKPSEILRSGNTVRPGMSKNEVRALYGDPDTKRSVVSKEWGGAREEWHYRARISSLPASIGYAGEDAYLYFDDQVLTSMSDNPLGKSEEVPGDDAAKNTGK